MNWIELNGRRSDEMTGLLIQSLPPIMKPLIRTEIEEIDGRDGDLVTKLGYSAYDREMLIGLHGKYDIDEIIEYFDSEGIVVFSNEPEKYYKYQIINQIDFERLARFRQATVTFHCQPFKFSSVDNKIKYDNNFITWETGTYSESGIEVTMNQNMIRLIAETSSSPVEFTIPVKCHCPDGLYSSSHDKYKVMAYSIGADASNVSIRVCRYAPSNPSTLGHSLMALTTNGVSSQSQTMTETTDYDLLYFYIAPNTDIDITIYLRVINTNYKTQEFLNKGNTMAKPVFRIFGRGTVSLKHNDKTISIANLYVNQAIVLDTVELNAYVGAVGNITLKNRNITGDLKNLWFQKGENTLTLSGDIISIEAEEYSRWI